MKIYEFLILSDEQQYQTVWDKGTHVGTAYKNGLTCQLYSVGDFYVEVQYNPGTNKIVGKLPFKQGAHLDAYIGLRPED